MMRTAVIDESGAVVNVIVADPEKDSIPGFQLVAVPEGQTIDQRWVWSAEKGFHPGPELQVEIDAQTAEIEALGYDVGD